MFGALALALVAVLIAGLALYLHWQDHGAGRSSHAAGAAPSATASPSAAHAQAAQIGAVHQAYLAWWSALAQADLTGDDSVMAPLDTPAWLGQDKSSVQALLAGGRHFRLTLTHDPQIVVYSNGTAASVDDVLTQHRVPVDAGTLTPTGPAVDLILHGSTALLLSSGHWLVDSSEAFGSDGSDPSYGISYATTATARTIPRETRTEIETAFSAYNQTIAGAFQQQDSSLLTGALLSPIRENDLAFVQKLRSQGQGFALRDEHNYRIGLKDPQTAYVYDTLADNSFSFDFSTKVPLPANPFSIKRESFEFKDVGGTWKVDTATVIKVAS